MTRIGFIGRTKILSDTIRIFQKLTDFEISFIWTCKDEDYYDFGSEKFKQLAADVNCPFIYSSDTKKMKNSVSADIVVSINFINIIPQEFISKFKFGIINAHAGDLPRYKGNACPNWAILNKEEFVVLSFHKMDAGLDSGPIIFKEKFILSNNIYIGEVYDWLQKNTPKYFVNAVNHLVGGGFVDEQSGRALRTFPRKPDDAKLDFSADLDWNYRLIRASSKPFSGAYAHLNHSPLKVIIYRAEPYSVEYDFLAVSGQVLEFSEEDLSFLVAIGNDVIKVLDYSIDGSSKKDSFRIISGSLRNRLT